MTTMKAAVLSLALAFAGSNAAPAFAGVNGDGASLFRAKRMPDRALALQSGGSSAGSETSLHGVVSDNQVVNASTGGNQIGGGALAGAAGIPVVIQNTGNNVLIQSATIVNVQVK